MQDHDTEFIVNFCLTKESSFSMYVPESWPNMEPKFELVFISCRDNFLSVFGITRIVLSATQAGLPLLYWGSHLRQHFSIQVLGIACQLIGAIKVNFLTYLVLYSL